MSWNLHQHWGLNRCSALSDRDPDRYENTATDENSSELKGVARYISNLSKSTHCRLFVNSRTFEFDLAVEGNNLQIMSDVLYRMFSNDCAPRKLIEDMQNKKWDKETKEERENAAKTLVSVIKNRGKGQFALHLFDSDKCNSLSIPPYIKDALKWVLPPDVNHTR